MIISPFPRRSVLKLQYCGAPARIQALASRRSSRHWKDGNPQLTPIKHVAAIGRAGFNGTISFDDGQSWLERRH
jgi:hypothetical protein